MTVETMQAIWASSRADAWFQAVNKIITDKNWEAFHFVVEIDSATKSRPVDHDVEAIVDNFLIENHAQPLETVAETIFPASEYRRYGRNGVYTRYPQTVYPEIKDRTWGTYAHRLVRRESAAGEDDYNPLKECVEKMKRQLARLSTFRACYELDVVDSRFDLHTYEGITDSKRLRSGPCLSHLSFKISSCNRLLLTAIYRYHYYIERFLGNMLGLAQLQRFICDETGLEPGQILCVSTFAKVETNSSWGKEDVRELIRDIEVKSGWTLPDCLA